SSFLYFNKAMQLAREQRNDSVIMESESGLGKVANAMNKFKEAQQHFDKAISLAKSSNNLDRLMLFLISESYLLNETDQYALSLEQSNAALAIAVQRRSKRTEAAIYRTMANSNLFSNKYDVALDLLNHSAKIYDSLKNYKGVADD